MSSSAERSSPQLELPPIAGLSISSNSNISPCLQSVLLRQPSISQDQQVVAKLLQTSKQLQAAVEQQRAGQLQLMVQPRKLQQVEGLAQWLQRYGHLVCGLEVDLTREHSSHCIGTERYWLESAVSVLEAGIKAAAAAGALQLQSFSLTGSVAGASLLLQLPAGHLTRLHVDVDFSSSSSSMWAVAALKSLRRLELINRTPSTAATDKLALEPLASAADLQQLTQLQVGPVRPAQLQCLQPLLLQLQQLHITADLGDTQSAVARQLLGLAQLLKLHAGIVRSLEVVSGVSVVNDGTIKAAFWELVAALQEAAPPATWQEPAPESQEAAPATPTAAAAAVAAAAGATAPASQQGLKLQSFVMGCSLPVEVGGPLLRALPSSSLTHLQFPLNWRIIAQVEALGRLTALRSCNTTAPRWSADNIELPTTALASQDLGQVLFNRLQQLTRLHLDGVGREQLQQLQLPKLQELHVCCEEHAPQAAVQTNLPGRGRQLNLSHLSSVQKLVLRDTTPLLDGDLLPPNLRELVLLSSSQGAEGRTYAWSDTSDEREEEVDLGWSFGATVIDWSHTPVCWVGDDSFSVQPLLALSHLQKLHIQTTGAAAECEVLAQLSSLRGLQELGVSCSASEHVLSSAAAAAWLVLPLKKLELCSVTVSGPFLRQLTAFQGLTYLCLDNIGEPYARRPYQGVHAVQLAAVVQQLPNLRSLTLKHVHSSSNLHSATSDLSVASVPDAVKGIAALAQAIGGLQELGEVRVHLNLFVELDDVAAVPGMLGQLLPSSLVPHCAVRKGLLKGSTFSICEPEDY